MTDVHVGHVAGTDFLQQDAIRGAVRQTYRSVGPTDRQAERFYSPEELAGLPDETVRIALGVGNPVRHAGHLRADSPQRARCSARRTSTSFFTSSAGRG